MFDSFQVQWCEAQQSQGPTRCPLSDQLRRRSQREQKQRAVTRHNVAQHHLRHQGPVAHPCDFCLTAALPLVLGRVQLDHVVDSQDSDRRLGGKLDHLDFGKRWLDDSRLEVVLRLARDAVKASVA